LLYIIVLAIIVATLLGVSLARLRTVKTHADFTVAGRRLAWPVLVFTLLSSWIGAGSLFAGGEFAFHHGFAALWMPAGGWAGLAVIALIAGRARRFAQFTVPELIEARFNAAARVLATIAILLAYTAITSYQFRGGGDVLHLIFPELPADRGMYIIAAFVILFTALAGMSSVAYLDLVIGLLVSITAIAAVPILFGRVGGWSGLEAALPASHFQPLGDVTPRYAFGKFLPTMLLLLGNQSMYQKFFSARSEGDAKRAVAGWIIGTVILETVIVTIAVAGSALFRDVRPHDIVPVTARLGLPPLLGAILLGGIFAKVISTANNYLFSPATNVVHDIYHRFINPQAGNRRLIWTARFVIIALGLFALALQSFLPSILSMAMYAYTVYGAGITPVVLAVFFWKRANGPGAVASIAAGTCITLAWNVLGILWARQVLSGALAALGAWASNVDAVFPAVVGSLLCLVVVSLATAPPRRQEV
jgi:SSS family solute:Na+ symporter/sodium/proline symporter